ncbi:MAG: hypothetical protein WC710_14285 [Gallionella sp.]|jgi:hypothetical protein
MAQTTAQVSAVDAKIEVSAAGSVWTDISGSANKVDLGAQDRAVGSAFTFDGDGALLTYGKRQPLDVTVTVIYTETATTEGFEFVRALHETVDGATMYLRWTPIGEVAVGGRSQFSTGKGYIKSFQYPPVAADSGDPILTTFTVTAANIVRTASVTA